MPITVNENGVLYELSEVCTNESGTLYEFDTIHSNEGGTLYEIHSAWKPPSQITWSGENTSTVSILTPSDSGYSCNIITHTLASNNTTLDVTANMSIKGKTTISFTYEEAYWTTSTSGLKAQYWVSIVATNASTAETISATVPAAPSARGETYSVDLPTGNYDVVLKFTVYDTGTQSRNITITAAKAA